MVTTPNFIMVNKKGETINLPCCFTKRIKGDSEMTSLGNKSSLIKRLLILFDKDKKTTKVATILLKIMIH